jgi:pimeloyl-ACP methyl ester carboxylesterase
MATRFLSLPSNHLTEPASIALAEQIECATVATSLSPQPIATTYVRQGQGTPPLVLLHGFDSSVFEFRRLLPLLATHYETWAIDLLGFGFTNRGANLAFSPAAIKTHLYACWKAWIKQPMTLVGASMGGAAAIDFTLSYPEAVRNLVLISSAGFSASPAMGRLMIPPISYLATAFLRNLKVRQSISLKAYHNPSLASADALRCAALHLNQTNWQQALIAFTRSGGYGSFQSQLAQLQLPTLILWGAQDRILGTEDAEKFHQAIPHSRLIWIDACGHVPHLEKPQITADYLLDFVRASANSARFDASFDTSFDPNRVSNTDSTLKSNH